MAASCLECLTEDGNYSKLRIGTLLLGLFSIAFLVWLIVLTVQMNQLECDGESDLDLPGWKLFSETELTCGKTNNEVTALNVKSEELCKEEANNDKYKNVTNFIWIANDSSNKLHPHHCVLLKSCKISETRLPGSPGITLMKDSEGNFQPFSKTEDKTCDEKDKIGDTLEDIFRKECEKEAEKTKDANYIAYVEPFTKNDANGNKTEMKSQCTFYKSCEVKKGEIPEQPTIILQKVK